MNESISYLFESQHGLRVNITDHYA